MHRRRGRHCATLCTFLIGAWAATTFAQTATDRELSQQADRRIRELQAQADRLASEARTLLSELRGLELQRQIKTEERRKADAELAVVTKASQEASARLAVLERQRIAATPGVKERLVELYKRGRAGYVTLLLQTNDLRALGRMSRGVASVARLDQVRFESHRRTIRAGRAALAELDARQRAVAAAQIEAARARAALSAAVAAHNRRLDALDQERDTAARYVGELQQAQSELQQRLTSQSGGAAGLPLAPFRGSLEWPVAGRVLSRFGRGIADRFGTAIVRNGIEIAALPAQQIRAVHGGTVSHAAPFTGFGTLVILDHGDGGFTSYGHLMDATVVQGARVERGAVIGRAGRNPAGVQAVYFEVRIDGRPVDPLQWLRNSR